MVKLTMKVRGTSAMIANLRAYDRRLQREVRAAVAKSAEVTRQRVRALVPVRTGFLRANVRSALSPDGLTFAVGWSEDDFKAAGKAFYAAFVEYGTTRMPARPSLGPGGREGAEHLKRAVRDALSRSTTRRGR